MKSQKNIGTGRENPYLDMSWWRFIALSFLFWFTFPVSLVIFLVFLGWINTKFFLLALWRDFWQTVVVLILAVIVAFWGLYELLIYIIDINVGG